jgi:hypothetical protein
VDLADHVLADVVCEPPQQLRDEEADLGGPGRRVGPHGEDAAVERLGLAVVRDLVAHDVPPPTDHATDRHLLDPAAITQQPRQGVGDRLRVAAVTTRRTARRVER